MAGRAVDMRISKWKKGKIRELWSNVKNRREKCKSRKAPDLKKKQSIQSNQIRPERECAKGNASLVRGRHTQTN